MAWWNKTSPTRWIPTKPSIRAPSRACSAPSIRTRISSIPATINSSVRTRTATTSASACRCGLSTVRPSWSRRSPVYPPLPHRPPPRAAPLYGRSNRNTHNNTTTTEVADLLKGPRGTQVTIVVSREGSDQPITFTVIRDEISRSSVKNAIWLKPGIAYVFVEQFNETTSKELEDSLKKLGENNIHGLVLDLRENPGGLLNEGVAVADKFLQKGQTIVSHRGRSSPEKTYTARNGNHGHEYP